ncbi:MAG: thiamine-phosphate kinase [Candidatus Altiarchaeota archaeon]
MNIKEIGGEFALIEKVTRKSKDPKVVIGVGDDAAVIDVGMPKYLLITTDMLCEGDHFRCDWYTPRQIGAKAMEANVSDVAAMGGLPRHAFVSIALTESTTVEWVEEFYKGLYEVADRFGFEIIGGDTTHSSKVIVSITLTGEVEPDNLRLRSHAKVGDMIVVTGDLGKSKAGLELLLKGVENIRGSLPHLEPKCRLEEARIIAPVAHAMIDVSDGLASEVNHICEQSHVGARVYAEKIPIEAVTEGAASTCGHDPLNYALNGGEDYELVFTIEEEKIGELKKKLECPLTVVGEITEKEKGILLIDQKGKENPLKGGYDHFGGKP